MICPNCSVQMHQYKEIGGGEALDAKYETWAVLKCPSCTRLVKELYSCEVITQKQVNELEKEMATIIIPEIQ